MYLLQAPRVSYAKRLQARVGYCKAKECRFEMRDKKKQGAVMITDKGE